MKSHLEIIRVKDRSEEWFQHRNNYIGSSEAGAVMGLSEYTPAIRVFDEKVGKFTPERFDNKFTFWGKELEDLIAEVWQYYRGIEPDDYIYYKGIGEIQRRNKRVNGIVINPKYPWLSANLDRVINKGQFRIDDYDKVTESECPLEIKEIDQFAAGKWESGVPPQYLFQVFHQCIILEVDYGEICLKQTDRKLNVIPVELRDTIKDAYLETTKTFMEKVEQGRLIYAQMREAEEAMDMVKHQELEAQLVELEPPVEESDAYVKYLKERYQQTEETILGNEDTLQWVKEYEFGGKIEKIGKAIKTASKANLLDFMRDNAVLDNGKEVTCSNRGRVTIKYKGEYTNEEVETFIEEISKRTRETI